MKQFGAKAIVVAGALYFMFFGGAGYKSLTPEKAAEVMAENPECMVVDVRTESEYAGGHIPGAVNIPLDRIQAGDVADALPDKHQVLLVYCYAGRRSVDAAKKLASMGYTNAYEFGGIVDWKGEVTEPEEAE